MSPLPKDTIAFLDHLYLNRHILKKYHRGLLAHQKRLRESLAWASRSNSPTVATLAAKLQAVTAQIASAVKKGERLERQIEELFKPVAVEP